MPISPDRAAELAAAKPAPKSPPPSHAPSQKETGERLPSFKELPLCVACGGKRTSSKGGMCVPCGGSGVKGGQNFMLVDGQWIRIPF